MSHHITKQTTYEEFVTEATRLRGLADAAENELLSYLYDGEKHGTFWKDTGYTFIQFVEQTQIVEVTRYIAWKNVRESLGPKATARVGVHAIVEAGRLQDPEQQREVLDEARLWEKTNGSSISQKAAKKIRSDFRTRTVARKVGHKSYSTIAEQLVKAEATLETLKAENAALKTENEKLRAENEQLRAEREKPRSAQPPAPTPPRRTRQVPAYGSRARLSEAATV